MRCAGVALGAALAIGCADDGGPTLRETEGAGTSGTGTGTGVSGTGTGAGTGTGTETDTAGDEPWAPGTVYPSLPDPNPRGFVDLRGLVHTHSPYSHDACDGEPRDPQGNLDAVCVEDLRRAICQVQHDYIMLTDHRDSFSDSTYPDVLLYDPERGDALIERGGNPVANRAGCDDGAGPTVILAGAESATMPVGLEGHPPGDHSMLYGTADAPSIQALKDAGAVILVSHTEDWSVDQLTTLPLDGFEMYNLHANLLSNLAGGAALLQLLNTPELLPHSDLVVFPIWQEDDRYLQRWGAVLAGGAKRVTTLATDAHRNTLPQELPDGERIDSFRRMMQWFSNHLLVQGDGNGGWDDTDLKDALRSGRLYGAFEYMGYPEGFDSFVEVGSDAHELGATVSLDDSPEIVAVAPTVRELDPDQPAPVITLHVLRATVDGFDEVASGDADLRYAPTEAGAYRVEVRIEPRHLEVYLGQFSTDAADARVWIYANPFYVDP